MSTKIALRHPEHDVPCARIIKPGMFTTVQDAGRTGCSALAVPPSGATDRLSLMVANRLLGNPDGAAVLEYTLLGPTLTCSRDTTVCIAGATCPNAVVIESTTRRPLKLCTPTKVRAGDVIHIGPLTFGARGILAVDGGFGVPFVLASRSTLVAAAIGGHYGRSLREEDQVPLGPARSTQDLPAPNGIESWLADAMCRRNVRIISTLHTPLYSEPAIDTLTSAAFTVADHSNRVGIRLLGPTITASHKTVNLASEGTVTGSIQVPPAGNPIVLGVDRPTTGGYPMIACVAALDLHILGMACPREELRFNMISHDEARAQLRAQQHALDALLPPQQHTIDLNADVGESDSDSERYREEAIYHNVTSVNIACGGHAGDERSMRDALARARDANCAAGAHPSYPDRAFFGRRTFHIATEALRDALTQQINSLALLAREVGIPLRHVKPHGALYHDASKHDSVARAIFDAAQACDPDLRLVGCAHSRAIERWKAWGASVMTEAFVDRAYEPDGSLRDRTRTDALITDHEHAARQSLSIAMDRRVNATDGSFLSLHAQTLCLHADNPSAVTIARRVRAALSIAGISVRYEPDQG